MKNKRINLPISYSVSQFDSERFLKLRVGVMHSGLNLNGSEFGADSIEKAAPTLANIPLLAFVKKEDGVDQADFAGHEFEIRISENGIKYVYLGRPIGIVPESNNYSFELDEESGKMFVYVDAYVWRDYANEALDIIERDGSKRVSMEVRVNDYEDGDGAISITDYTYTGIAILGNDVQEAMIGARAEIAEFTDTKQVLSELLFELKSELEAEPIEEVFEEEEQEQEQTQEQEEVFEQEQELEQVQEPESEPESESFNQEPEPESEQTTEEEFEKEDVEIEAEAEPAEFDYHSLIVALEQENARLQILVDELQMAQKQAVLDEFQDLAEVEGFSAIQSKLADLSIEDLKLQLFALRGQQQAPTNPVHRLVYNYIGGEATQSNEPSWASLVKSKRGGN